MPTETQQKTGESNNNTSPTKNNSLQYPLDYDSYSGLWLVLDEYEYFRTSSDIDPKTKSTGNSISLPVPVQLSNSYNINWNTTELGAFGNFVQNNISSISESVGAYKNDSSGMSTTDIIGKVAGGIGEGGKALASDFLFDTNAGKAASKALGIGRNPFMAVVFEGVELRTFNFAYRFFPKSEQEAQVLRKIIETFEQGIHPSYVAGYQNMLFKYPNMYKPKFVGSSQLFNFGYCVVSNLEINYHGQGIPVYFNKGKGDKIPASIDLQFTLKEMEVITKEFFTGGPGSSVGILDTASQGAAGVLSKVTNAATNAGSNVFTPKGSS